VTVPWVGLRKAAGAEVWLLANDATPKILMIEAVKLVLAGRGVLILAQRAEPEVDARTALLRSLDLMTPPLEEGERA